MHHILFYTPFKLSTWNNEVLRFSTHHILHASQTQKEQSMVFCDLVLIIFYTPLKLIHGAILTHFCLVSIIFYTHLKPNKATKSKSGSFVLIIFYILSNCLYDSSLPFPVLYPSYSTHISNVLTILWSGLNVLYPSYSTHLSNQEEIYCIQQYVLYPSYSTHLSNSHLVQSILSLVLYPSYSTHLSNLKRVVYKACKI